ncbi:hypothetical protein [Streptomyces sp. NPDC056227]|uniref:hypothetical protein n=1 Tax=Streptomyces sp. NPDC056227 TaxID=3345753 RepID=UPI0035DAEACE
MSAAPVVAEARSEPVKTIRSATSHGWMSRWISEWAEAGDELALRGVEGRLHDRASTSARGKRPQPARRSDPIGAFVERCHVGNWWDSSPVEPVQVLVRSLAAASRRRPEFVLLLLPRWRTVSLQLESPQPFRALGVSAPLAQPRRQFHWRLRQAQQVWGYRRFR